MYRLTVLVDDLPIGSTAALSCEFTDDQRISIVIQSRDGMEVHRIFEQVHSVGKFNAWLERVRSDREVEHPPAYLPPRASLVEAIASFYDSAADGHLDLFEDDLLAYRCRPDLRFGFRGTDVPSVLVSTWQGRTTVSSTANGGFSYNVDLQ